jgi:hypothetical protein
MNAVQEIWNGEHGGLILSLLVLVLTVLNSLESDIQKPTLDALASNQRPVVTADAGAELSIIT